MIRVFVLTAAALLAGCGPMPVRVPEQEPTLFCPAHHTASCDFVPGQRRPDPATCVCMRNSDLNRMFRR